MRVRILGHCLRTNLVYFIIWKLRCFVILSELFLPGAFHFLFPDWIFLSSAWPCDAHAVCLPRRGMTSSSERMTTSSFPWVKTNGPSWLLSRPPSLCCTFPWHFLGGECCSPSFACSPFPIYVSFSFFQGFVGTSARRW